MPRLPSAAFAVLALLATCPPLTGQEPTSPVALHAGPAWVGLPVNDFDVVESLAGQSAYSEVRGQDHRADFGAFLSHRLGGSDESEHNRTLFSRLELDREWGLFASVSFAVIR